MNTYLVTVTAEVAVEANSEAEAKSMAEGEVEWADGVESATAQSAELQEE